MSRSTGPRGGSRPTGRGLWRRTVPARTAWHVTPGLAAGYAAGELAETDCWSVETHLESCASCAGRVSAAVRGGNTAPALAAVRAAVLAAAIPEGAAPHTAAAPEATADPGTHAAPEPAVRPGGSSRPKRRPDAVRSPWRRRARMGWAVGPALRGPWLLSVLAVAAAAVGAAHLLGFQDAQPMLLTLAPVLPAAGVAVAYGRHTDPLHELAASTPSGGLRLLLIRTAVVLAVSLPLLTFTSLLLPSVPGGPSAAAWLLPGLALTLAALALGSYIGCRNAAAAVGTGWLLAVSVPAVSVRQVAEPFATAPGGAVAEVLGGALSGPAAQGGWAAAAVLCAGLIALRRTSFDQLEGM